VKAAGNNANFLLNVGPMPDGKIQPEFADTLALVGDWMKKNGESIYGTRGGMVPPQPWGVVTYKANVLYAHVLKSPNLPYVFIPNVKEKVTKVALLSDGSKLKFKQVPEGVFVYTDNLTADPIDTIIELTTN
jgi:alpha-L-fucosidase